jgi:hypothetical protein
MQQVFSRVSALTRQSDISCRARCLLKDVLELRAAGWQGHRPKQVEAPSTLKEVARKHSADENQASKAPKKDQARRYPNKAAPRKTMLDERNVGERNLNSASDVFASTRVDRLAALVSGKKSVGLKECGSDTCHKGVPAGSRTSNEAKRTNNKQFDRVACGNEMMKILAELRVSHVLSETLERVVGLEVPPPYQQEVLGELLERVAENGAKEFRNLGFELVLGLFKHGHWKPTALGKALADFMQNVAGDLKFDVPALPKILRDELHPMLSPLVRNGILQAAQHNDLLAEI